MRYLLAVLVGCVILLADACRHQAPVAVASITEAEETKVTERLNCPWGPKNLGHLTRISCGDAPDGSDTVGCSYIGILDDSLCLVIQESPACTGAWHIIGFKCGVKLQIPAGPLDSVNEVKPDETL